MIFKLKSIPGMRHMNNRLKFVRWLFEQDCVLCGAASGTHLLCPACHAGLPRTTAGACPRCAAPGSDGRVCGACLQHPPAFDRAHAVLDYMFPVDKLIQALKYRHQLALARLFGALLAHAVHAQPRPDCLLPMPLHPARLRERGFNQAHEIAKVSAQRLRLPLAPHLATRIINTGSQAKLALEARKRNVTGAFACEDAVRGRHIALVDDVMTSGATLDALAKTLKQAGAREISIWVVARAAPHK